MKSFDGKSFKIYRRCLKCNISKYIQRLLFLSLINSNHFSKKIVLIFILCVNCSQKTLILFCLTQGVSFFENNKNPFYEKIFGAQDRISGCWSPRCKDGCNSGKIIHVCYNYFSGKSSRPIRRRLYQQLFLMISLMTWKDLTTPQSRMLR